jgi:hypothetical protein
LGDDVNKKVLAALVLGFHLVAAHAQLYYDSLAAGMTVEGSVGLGFFSKPLVLPEGQWKIAARKVVDIPLVRGRTAVKESAGTIPQYVFTLRNADLNAVIPVMVLSITGRLTNLGHGLVPCPPATPYEWVERLPGAAETCARTFTMPGFRKMVSQGPRSDNPWVKANLDGITEDIDKLPDNVTVTQVSGTIWAGFMITTTYFLKQEGNLSDPTYAQYLQPWIHDAAVSLMAALKNDPAKLGVPKGFASVIPLNTAPAYKQPANYRIADAVPLKDIKIEPHFDFKSVDNTNFKEELLGCIPNAPSNFANMPLTAGHSATYKNILSPKIFFVKNGKAVCLNRSTAGFTIFAADAFLNTVNPMGVPEYVAMEWMTQIADLVARSGVAKVAYRFRNGNAMVSRYWVDPGKPEEINFSTVMKISTEWAEKDNDVTLEHLALTAVSSNGTNAEGGGRKGFPF